MKTIRSYGFELLFQVRHGFLLAYGFLLSVYIGILFSVPPGKIRETIAFCMVFSDTSVLGFFFVGSVIFLERQQHILEGLFVTPVSLTRYIFLKCAVLTTLALVVSAVLYLPVFGFRSVVPFMTGVLLSSIVYILIGIILAGFSRTLSGYLVLSIIMLFPTVFPSLEYFGLVRFIPFRLFPTYPSLVLIGNGVRPAGTVETLAAAAGLLLWVTFLWAAGYRVFNRRILGRRG